jgi:hypothetical protein
VSAAADTGLALRASWRMIDSVTVLPARGGEGVEADVRFDPIVAKGSLEQQGYPRTKAALARVEARRAAALEGCVRAVNEGLPPQARITSVSIEGRRLDFVPEAKVGSLL